MSNPFQLFRLQQLDTQLDRAHNRLLEIQSEIKKQEATLRQVQVQHEKSEALLQDSRKSLRKAEENVQQQSLKIEQNEAMLYSGKVRNPKELQDMQNEVAALKRYLSVLEDRQLEAMMMLEELLSGHSQVTEQLTEITVQVSTTVKLLNEERENLTREIQRLEVERKATYGAIPAEELELYEGLRQKRRGVAVAKVVDKNCEACGSTLNASLLHAARSLNQICRCDSCGRILYAG